MALTEQLPIPPPFEEESRVRREVWQSLVSMLRVYAYAASLSHGEIIVIETAPHAASLEHQGRALVLGLDLGSGKGSCRRQDSMKVPGRFEVFFEILFEIQGDGRLRLAGVEKQLDEAAIDWVEQLTRAEVD